MALTRSRAGWQGRLAGQGRAGTGVRRVGEVPARCVWMPAAGTVGVPERWAAVVCVAAPVHSSASLPPLHCHCSTAPFPHGGAASLAVVVLLIRPPPPAPSDIYCLQLSSPVPNAVCSCHRVCRPRLRCPPLWSPMVRPTRVQPLHVPPVSTRPATEFCCVHPCAVPPLRSGPGAASG